MLVSASAHAAAVSCITRDGQRILAGAPGPFHCTLKGGKAVLVGRRTSLRLATFSARVTATRTTRSLSTEYEHATAKGVFIVVTVQITNYTHEPQDLALGPEPVLEIGANRYSRSTSGEEADPSENFGEFEIQPEESASRDYVFDVTSKYSRLFPKHAVLYLSNFGTSLDDAREVGAIYLG